MELIWNEEISCSGFNPENPTFIRTFFNEHDQEIGKIGFVYSESRDWIFINGIQVEPLHRRKGYGLEMLKSIIDKFGLPLHPRQVNDRETAIGFWKAAQNLYGNSWIVLPY